LVGGERFDDPQREYRVLYGATQRLGALVEVLASFRAPAKGAEDAVARTTAPGTPAGTVDSSWRLARQAGAAVISGRFADIGSLEWLAYLNQELNALLREEEVSEFDAATLRGTANQRLTQAASRLVYECLSADGQPQFDGVFYESRFGNDLQCWALFERPTGPTPYHVGSEAFREEDPELVQACEILGLTLQTLSA
jgi:hypothetical protein